MTRGRRSAWAAVIVFALTAAVVVGALSWASVLQVRAAEDVALRRHQSVVRMVVGQLEGAALGILAAEASRPYTDYVEYHSAEPVAAWSEKGERVEADIVALPSPIALSGPPYSWIDLYFHVNEEGGWSSPQLWDEANVPSYHASSMLDWLQEALPLVELTDRVALARARDLRLIELRATEQEERVQEIYRVAGRWPEGRSAAFGSYYSRTKAKIAAQLSWLAVSQCVVQAQIHSAAVAALEDPLYGCSQPKIVGVSREPMATFWLPPKPGAGPKLAFVRTGHVDDNVVYQGFVADWERLKPGLLGEIMGLLAGVDLEPAVVEIPVTPASSETLLASIPVRLTGPGIENTGLAEARSDAVGVLLLAWAIAVTVLAVAGLGVRNLVALMNRRLQFAYAVTHELRTPLTTFRLYADMLAAGLVPEESRQQYLDSLNRESLRLSQLVQSVLEYARLENQKVKLNPVDTDPAALLQTIQQGMAERCARNGVRAEATCETSNGLRLRTDVGLVNQIAGVLVDNAVRHARRAESPAVEVRLSGDNARLHLEVADAGRGVARGDARNIFKPFRRGSGADADAERGIGLGLALARNWANLLGGRLDLISRHDPKLGGARFRLTIPARIEN